MSFLAKLFRRRHNSRPGAARLALEPLEPRVLLSGSPILSEFMAINDETLADKNGEFSDWIEIQNVGDEAMNLAGWHLTDDQGDPSQWTFPDTPLGVGESVIVFATSTDTPPVAGEELHANFSLSGGGEYLALYEPGGANEPVSKFDPFPAQVADVSYGIGQDVTVTSLLSEGAPCTVLVPDAAPIDWTATSFDDSGWRQGATGVGFEQSVPGLAVTVYKANVAVGNLAIAEDVLADPAKQASAHAENIPVINYFNTGGHGRYPGDEAPFPGTFIGQDANDFVTHATATVTIPAAGQWTFDVNSDDGFRLTILGVTTTAVVNSSTPAGSDNISFANPRGPGDTLGTFDFAAAGDYELELVSYERGGGSGLELFAAQGSRGVFNATDFHLVGDTANSGLAVKGGVVSQSAQSEYGALIDTDVEAEMFDVNASVYIRCEFEVADPAAYDSLTLRMNYDDGFVAYLNGVEVARRNAPDSPAWNSAAAAEHPDAQALIAEDINISEHLGVLQVGTNVLAIHGLNVAPDDPDFLIMAALADIDVLGLGEHYFAVPTPRSLNSTDFYAAVAGVELSHDHGFYDQPFDLTLSTDTAGAEIRYTLDGSKPTETTGFVYGSPIPVAGTTVVRATAFKDGYVAARQDARTYLFLADVLTQSPDGSPPAGWPGGSINYQILDYGMDPDIVNDPVWGPLLEDALLAIPTMSIVTDLDNLFDPATGIYVNARGDGIAWERPASLELIYPDGAAGDGFPDGADGGFQVNTGLRIRGGYSRSSNNPKHAFKLFFRDEYGDDKLRYPLFGSEGVDEFDQVDLRTSQNYSWAFGGPTNNTMVREVFSRDLQGEMGQPYTRSRYYHLYLNGQYWGIYQTQERSEADYAASYFGGDSDDYDVVKHSDSYEVFATDGNMDAYTRLWQATLAGFADNEAYYRAQGLNPNGTRNPDYEPLLDVDNVIDYMIITYYTGDRDGPASRYTAPRVNNYYAIYNREDPDGWKFFEHDSEHSLGTGENNMVEPLVSLDTRREQLRYFNVHWLHEQLCANQEYVVRFADRLYETLYNDGELTNEAALAKVNARADQIDSAIIAESARWGDRKTHPPKDYDDWVVDVNKVRNWVMGRNDVVVSQVRAVGWYPNVEPPTFTQHGGQVPDGFELRMSAATGTIYYTTDGTDPRLPGGGISPSAQVYEGGTLEAMLVSRGSQWRYLDDGSDQGDAWLQPLFPDEATWDSGPAQLGYGDGDEATVVSFGPDPNNKYVTSYFRHTFNVTDLSQIQQLTLRLVRDDGAVVYLNGQELRRSNMPTGAIDWQTLALGIVGGADESTFYEFAIDPALLVEGDNVLAVEVHQGVGTSSDISFDLELEATAFPGDPITLDQSTHVMARALDGGEWSALTQATFLSETPPPVRVTEVMYHPRPAPDGSPYRTRDFEFIEFRNVGTQTVSLEGFRFTDGVEFTFPQLDLPAGELVVIVSNGDAFESRYGTAGITIAGEYTRHLDDSGEVVQLDGQFGEQLLRFEYNDGGAWPGRADGRGSSLEIIDPEGDYNDPRNWRASSEFGGSPGAQGSGPVIDVVVNEVLTDPVAPDVDAIELYNRTADPIDVGGWFLSDSSGNYHKFRIPDGTTIDGHGYLVFDESDFNSSGGVDPNDFGLSAGGDDVWLLEADAAGTLVRFADHVEVDAAASGVAYGRWPNGVGPLSLMTRTTLGIENSGPSNGPLIISELMAINEDTLADADGDYSDWIEIHNTSGSAIDLGGWYLTDDPGNLTMWQFPSVVLPAGEYLVVFASGKHPTGADSGLHTSFELSGDGDFLALVLPDETTIAHQYGPAFPKQLEDVSYGIDGTSAIDDTLVDENAAVRVLVPVDDSLGSSWTGVLFDDQGWASGDSGVGFDAGQAGFEAYVNFQPDGAPVPDGYVPDAGEAFGDRGNGFAYGWSQSTAGDVRDREAHADQRYDTLDHMQKGGVDKTWEIAVPNDTYNVLIVCGDPTLTDHINTLDVEGTLLTDPDGGDNFDEYTLIVDVTDGRLTIRPAAGASNAKIAFVEVSSATTPSYRGLIETDLEAEMLGQRTSAYVRTAFDVADPADYSALTLRMKYDDAFVAYLNGLEVARRNAPASPAFDAVALAERPREQVVVFEDIDLTGYIAELRPGANVLAVHGLNASAADTDFLIVPSLVGRRTLATLEQYFTTPTPGEANIPGALGLVADTTFGVDRGFFAGPFDVVITTATPGAEIRYTLDGSTPTATTGLPYGGSIPIRTTTTLRAAAFKPGYIATNVDTHTYIFLDDVLAQDGAGFPDNWGHAGADYAMDPDVVADYRATILDDMQALPALSLVMDADDWFASGGQGIYIQGKGSERAVSAELIFPDGSDGFQINAAVQIQGGTSTNRWKVDKLSMRLKFKEPYGPTKLGFPVFDDTPLERFDTLVLDAMMNLSWLHPDGGQRTKAQYVRDQYVADVQNALGSTAPHGRYVHLYLNGLSWGLYWLHERPDESFAAAYLGGDKDDYDVIKHNPATLVNGTNANYNEMLDVASAGLSTDAQYQAIQQYLDVPDLVDYMITNFYVGNTDWAHHNWYASRSRVDPNGRWRFHSWDAEHVLKGAGDDVTDRNNSGAPTFLHQKLLANGEYRMLFADHVQRAFSNDGPLAAANAAALYQSRLDEVDRAIVGESARWGDNRRPDDPYTRDDEWLAERDWLLNAYFPGRSDEVLDQLSEDGLYPDVVAPAFNQHGGPFDPSFDLTIDAPAGTIYYTLDGSDPRLPGGDVAPGALIDDDTPITLTESTLVKARALDGTTWSALNEATFVTTVILPLRITEVMYHPAAPPEGSPYAAEDFEFIELQNLGAAPVELEGIHFTDGVDFTFPQMPLAPGDYVVIVGNQAAFESRYGTAGITIAGQYAGLLDNDGETIDFEGRLGDSGVDAAYSDAWLPSTDGGGFSLAIIDANGQEQSWVEQAGWRPSANLGGSPGADDPGHAPGAIVINEVLAHTDQPAGDWIELHNTADAPIDISGWFLSDDPANPTKYQIQPTAPIPAGGYVAFTQTQHFGAAFGLSELGNQVEPDEGVYLTSLDASGAAGGYRESVSFGASEREVTFGRHTTSTGAVHFTAMTAPTFEGANSDPLVGPVVINEIMYHPDDGGDEFIELHNTSAATVPLYDSDNPTNTWRLGGAVDYAFPTAIDLPANGYLLVVPTDPAGFRATYGIPAGVPIYGPYAGALRDSSESVKLYRPGQPEPDLTVPQILVDRVKYDDGAPWPGSADGDGPSLARRVAAGYGSDPANWAASLFHGTPGAANQLHEAAAAQPIDYQQDFAAGRPNGGAGWEYYASTGEGRVHVVDGALRLDDGADNATATLVEAILHLDLAGATGVVLTLDHATAATSYTPLPATFIGHADGDGIAFSADGVTWHRLADLEEGFDGRSFQLDPALQAAGVSYTGDFQLKLQQYGSAPDDGRALDDIRVRANYETFDLALAEGWNLVAVPVEPLDSATDVVFPTAVVDAVWEYRRVGGYVVPDEVHAKKGFWVLATSPADLQIGGFRPSDTSVTVQAGWNLIGAVASSPGGSQPVPSDPPAQAVWQYDNPGGYSNPTQCGDGVGFWLLASEDATLWGAGSTAVVNAPKDATPKQKATTEAGPPQSFVQVRYVEKPVVVRLVATDSEGAAAELRAPSSELRVPSFELRASSLLLAARSTSLAAGRTATWTPSELRRVVSALESYQRLWPGDAQLAPSLAGRELRASSFELRAPSLPGSRLSARGSRLAARGSWLAAPDAALAGGQDDGSLVTTAPVDLFGTATAARSGRPEATLVTENPASSDGEKPTAGKGSGLEEWLDPFPIGWLWGLSDSTPIWPS